MNESNHKKAAAPCYQGAALFVCRKPLARRVVQKKPYGDDVDEKTPFALE
jgi:hypothetical protein